MNFDSDLIMAYVDGELDLVTAKRIERAAEGDTALAARIAAQRALRARLAAHYNPVLEEALPDRLTAPLDRVDIRLARGTRRLAWPVATAMAASLALGLLVGPRLFAPDAGPVAVRGDTLVAQGALADALDTQLASAPASGAAVRIGLTFRDRSGDVCRSFESAAVSGIACHDGQGWTLHRAASGARAQTYRQAAADAMIAEIDAIRDGDIADAETERAWRDNGWRTAAR